MNQKSIDYTGSAQIREQQTSAPKFRSQFVDVMQNNHRVKVITQPEALRGIAAGTLEPVGHGTIKYVRVRNLAPATGNRSIYPWSGAKRGDRFTESESKPGRFRS